MPRNDFNGDGRSDILWRDNNGTYTDWLGTANGGFTPNWSNVNVTPPSSWTVLGTGDFNGDSRTDILWSNSALGIILPWRSTGSGFFSDWDNAFAVPGGWSVAGTGDFNGDSYADILWRSAQGAVTTWLGSATGEFSPNWANAAPGVSSEWWIAGIGDFNGDHKSDILWQSPDGYITQWFGGTGGSLTATGEFVRLRSPIEGVGDFNGDGRSDIVAIDDWSFYSVYFARANGRLDLTYAPFADGATGWSVAAVGDYNGDHIDDILWRHENGDITNSLGSASGTFLNNDGNAWHELSTVWQIQPNPAGLGLWDY